MTIEISIEEFSRVTSGEDNIGFSNKTYLGVYNFYKNFKDQKDTYVVKGYNDFDTDKESVYRKFGIYLRDIPIVEESRSYLLIIDSSNNQKSLEERVQDYVSQYLPENVVPDYFVIDKEIKTYQEYYYWVNQLKEIYPYIAPLANYSELIKQRYKEQDISNMIVDAVSMGYYHYFIDKHIEDIAREFKSSNYATIPMVEKAEREILEEYKKNRNLILMYSGSSDNDFIVASFCAYMFYKHKINSHLYIPTTQIYLNKVSSLMYDNLRMLAEEKINYLKNLPDVACTFNPDLSLTFGVYLETRAMSCTARIAYTDYDTLGPTSTVTRTTMNIRDIVIIPINYEVELSVKSLPRFREVHDRFFEKLVQFESICESKAIMDLTNVFFMEVNGNKKIAHLEEINVDLPAVLYPLHKDLVKTKVNFSLEDIPKLYPLNVLGGYQRAFGRFIVEVKAAYEKAIGTPLDPKMRIYQHNHAFGIMLEQLNNIGPKLLNVEEYKDFVTLGLWWEETFRFRGGLHKTMQKYMDIKKSRHYSKFYSIFGGPFALFREDLIFREEFLKEW
jgi:hypothetical protein